MNYNSNFRSTINELKAKGFQEDFILFDDELYWVQQNVFLRENDFSICDYLILEHPGGKKEDLVLFCIKTVFTPAKGILMNHYGFTQGTPSLIIHKLHGVKVNAAEAARLLP